MLSTVKYFSFLIAVLALAAMVGCEYSSSVKWGAAGGSGEDPDSAADDSSPVVQIHSPRNGDVIVDDVYHDMRGVAYDLPPDKRLVVFASDEYNYFLMYPFPRRDPTGNAFQQTNVRLATESERWQLHVCLATRDAITHLSSCARRNQWDFAELPEGVERIESVHVKRGQLGG